MTSQCSLSQISPKTPRKAISETFPSCGKGIGRYRDTATSEDFAFVSFEDKTNTPKAINKMNGRCNDNLILDVQWGRKCLSIPELECSNFCLYIRWGAL